MPGHCPSPPPVCCKPPPGGGAGRLFDLAHKLVTGMAAAAMLVKLLLG